VEYSAPTPDGRTQKVSNVLRLPIPVTKFITPKPLTPAEFLHLWKFTVGVSLGPPPPGTFFEYCAVFKMNTSKPFDFDEVHFPS
jgi:hypothetical protein